MTVEEIQWDITETTEQLQWALADDDKRGVRELKGELCDLKIMLKIAKDTKQGE